MNDADVALRLFSFAQNENPEPVDDFLRPGERAAYIYLLSWRHPNIRGGRREYVGHSYDVIERSRQHIRAAAAKENSYLYKELAKANDEDVYVYTLAVVCDVDKHKFEQHYLEYFNTLLPNGMNENNPYTRPAVAPAPKHGLEDVEHDQLFELLNDKGLVSPVTNTVFKAWKKTSPRSTLYWGRITDLVKYILPKCPSTLFLERGEKTCSAIVKTRSSEPEIELIHFAWKRDRANFAAILDDAMAVEDPKSKWMLLVCDNGVNCPCRKLRDAAAARSQIDV